MPELAEVEYYRKQWDAGLSHRVLSVHVHPAARVFRNGEGAAIQHGLTGADFIASFAHGKNLLFQFSKRLWLGGHLGMTGELLTAAPGYGPQKHDHLVLFQKSAALIFRDPRKFGRLRIHQGPQPPPWWLDLPPEILSTKFDVAFIAASLARRSRSSLKAVLLDQSAFPGIGNWMADEILWQMRTRPARPAGELNADEIKALHRTTRDITRQALKTIGRTWADPPKTWLFQHRWKPDGRCPRCHALLLREEIGGRTTRWCANCQT